MKFTLNKVLAWLIALLVPFMLVMVGVRLVMTPVFPALEYRRPGFPADEYGFTRDQRDKWSVYAVNFLTNGEGPEYLGDLKDDNGSPLFRESEVTHMQDVQKVTQTSLTVWYVTLGFFFASLMWFLTTKNMKVLRRALFAGGWFTLLLVLGLIVYLALNFNQLFDQFHRIFFAEGSWLFYANDTLIRLFPLVFWRDAFILVLGFTLFAAFVMVLTLRPKKNPPIAETQPFPVK